MTPSPHDRRTHGIAVRQARLARVTAIRRRALASALALFVATWLLIATLLVTGHDPALARATSTTARKRTTATRTRAATHTTATHTTPVSGRSATRSSSPGALTSRQS